MVRAQPTYPMSSRVGRVHARMGAYNMRRPNPCRGMGCVGMGGLLEPTTWPTWAKLAVPAAGIALAFWWATRR